MQLQPEQAHFLLHDVVLPALRNEHGITKGVIEAIPVDKGDYRPDEISKSALDLAWHTVVTEMRFMEAPVSGTVDLAPRHRPDSVKNSADLASWYATNFDSHFDELSKVSDEQLGKVIDFRGVYQLPAVMYLRFMLNHTIHHRGQLSTYLRPMGAKVPVIYGESYDSSQARMAS